MYSKLNFGVSHPALAGSLGLARRIGVRAQFGDALLALRAALGRIGIRPQICYCASQIDAWMMVSWACRLGCHIRGLRKVA